MPGGMEVALDNTALIEGLLAERLGAVVAETAEALKERMRAKIEEGTKSGHLYTSGPEPLPHQASAPGESPANWTGVLKDAITSEMLDVTEAVVWVDVSAAPYAGDLEYGTVHMAPRPWFWPAAEEEEALFEARVAAAIG